jgi:hypothetical protein
MDKVQKPSDYERYTPPSEPFRFLFIVVQMFMKLADYETTQFHYN